MEVGFAKDADGLAVIPQGGKTVRQKFLTRILIIDSDELSVALIRASLETQDYLVFSAFDSEQALNIAAVESLDLVICDSDLHTSTGANVPTLINRIPKNSDVPFLFTSSSQKPDVISRRLEDRNVFFIRKPFEHEAFLELVEYAMWMPNLIRSHIEKIHSQQGLGKPHSAELHSPQSSSGIFPHVSIPGNGAAPISKR